MLRPSKRSQKDHRDSLFYDHIRPKSADGHHQYLAEVEAGKQRDQDAAFSSSTPEDADDDASSGEDECIIAPPPPAPAPRTAIEIVGDVINLEEPPVQNPVPGVVEVGSSCSVSVTQIVCVCDQERLCL